MLLYCVLSAHCVDVEAEAIAQSRLGMLYDKVLRLKIYSTKCFKQCLQLANTLVPRDFTTDGMSACCQFYQQTQLYKALHVSSDTIQVNQQYVEIPYISP